MYRCAGRWHGALHLPGGNVEIECVFDRQTESVSAFSLFEDKRVTITGRAFYLEGSQLPDLLGLIEIEEIDPADAFIDFKGALRGKSYFDWDG